MLLLKKTHAAVLLTIALAQGASVYAEKIPTYKEVNKILPEIWRQRYPIKPQKFIPDPEKKGILAAVDRGRNVYYYHFHVVIPRPFRKEDETVVTIDKREAELWVRYRSFEKDPWDLTFARRDILPGENKRWIK
jgi:hypothetical protein